MNATMEAWRSVIPAEGETPAGTDASPLLPLPLLDPAAPLLAEPVAAAAPEADLAPVLPPALEQPADRLYGTSPFLVPNPALDDLANPLPPAEPPAALGITSMPLSGNPLIDGVLLDGRKWAGATISYAFPSSSASYEYPYGAFNEPSSGFSPASWQQQGTFSALLEGQNLGRGQVSTATSVESFTQLDFVQSYGGGDLRIGLTGLGYAPAWAYYPADAGYGGDIWFSTGYGYGYDFRAPVLGDYFYHGHLHEMAHALGLKSGHETGPAPTYTPALPWDWDSLEFTVSTYRSYVGAPIDGGYRNEWYGYPQTFMMLDIAALQYLYGADFTTRAGDTTYRWSPVTGEMSIDGVGQGTPGANRIFLTIWDGGGRDAYDMSNYATSVAIDLTPGKWSVTASGQLARLNAYDGNVLARGNVFNALQFYGDPRSLIEDATGGAGNDVIVGNAAGNRLSGGAGADTLAGQDGADTLDGGTGDDSLAGGSGDDLFRVDSAGDRLSDSGGADTVEASASFTLPGSIGTLALTGGAQRGSGNALDNLILGNEAANTLAGAAGRDSLEGRGGADRLDGGTGADTLAGGTGNDTYVVDEAGDRVTESADAGRDVVLAGVDWSLGDNVENLTLTGGAGLDGTGNALGNVITGNAAANLLAGLAGADRLGGGGGADTLDGGNGADTLDGGAGADSMAGGGGNDRYVVDDAGDVVRENPGAGADIVYASVSFSLGAELDHLTLTGGADLAGSGNVLANRINGNAGANLLGGGGAADTLSGGAGADTLTGGAGADSLVGGADADLFRWLAANQGGDTVRGFDALDEIAVSRSFGGGLVEGPLAEARFEANATGEATQGTTRFVLNTTTGLLSFDADGSGAKAAIAIATFTGGELPSFDDIAIIA